MDILGVGKLVGSVINGIGDRRARKYELEKTIDLKKIEAAEKIDTDVAAQHLGQLEINKIEAQHKSIFVSGWRPFIGWVCGLSLLYNVILTPIGTAAGYEMPLVDPSLLYPVLLGMLGLGAMRTTEKMNGVTHR